MSKFALYKGLIFAQLALGGTHLPKYEVSAPPPGGVIAWNLDQIAVIKH